LAETTADLRRIQANSAEAIAEFRWTKASPLALGS
jgi:hypothetical protein